ncbi:hypothetical protein GCM10022246_40110 [Pedobacter ginsengiterrae]|uniref:Uncharacterized protein n=1 Tax=Pedobacter ginsengiterrae TaxID=871696 RepID=A0ABP7QLA2_9SPHI
MNDYLPKNLNAAPQKPSNQLNFKSNFSSTCTENSNISLLMIKNLIYLSNNTKFRPKTQTVQIKFKLKLHE